MLAPKETAWADEAGMFQGPVPSPGWPDLGSFFESFGGPASLASGPRQGF